MKDTIYREDAIESMAKAIWHHPNELYPCLNSYEHAHDLAEQGLKFLPSAEPETGKWEPCFGGKFKGGAYWYSCSKCKKIVPGGVQGGYFFCPNCGSNNGGKYVGKSNQPNHG